MKRSIWPIVLAAILGCAILIGLGVWQLQRLQWKEALLADLDRRAQAPAIGLADSLEQPDIDYRHVMASGLFLPGELHVLTTLDGQPAWDLVQILLSDDGVAVLVDRGAMPDDMRDKSRRPPLPDRMSFTAVASRHAVSPGFFTPDNDVAGNVWYSWDIPAMLAAAHVPADAKVARFVLHALEPPPGQTYPKPVPLQTGLYNNHLQYALTWFALAIILVVMATLFMRQEKRRPKQERSV